jgi:tetratricopeptide (TPR) repeat protein
MIHVLIWMLLLPVIRPADNPELLAGIQYYERASYQAAQTKFAELVRVNPDDPALRIWMGKTWFRLRKWDDAIREFEKASQLEPLASAPHLWLGRAAGRKAEHMVPLFAFPIARRVAREFEAAVRLAPDNLDARFDLMEFYLDAPGIVGGGKEKAPEQARAIAAIDRRLGYVAQSRIYCKEKQWESAQKELQRAVDEFPRDARSRADLAEFFLERLDFRRAGEAAARSVALAPGTKAKLILAASRVMMQQDLEKAEQDLQTILSGPLRDEDPSAEEVHFWLGQCFLVQGKKDIARKEFESALRFNPDYGRAKTGLNESR